SSMLQRFTDGIAEDCIATTHPCRLRIPIVSATMDADHDVASRDQPFGARLIEFSGSDMQFAMFAMQDQPLEAIEREGVAGDGRRDLRGAWLDHATMGSHNRHR